jgi:predicted HAD superfamily Cof-like phosphohydrolase
MSSILKKSYHQQQVESFMLRAGQEVPLVPTEPSPEVRILRAKLILEEALETIWKGLGVRVSLEDWHENGERHQETDCSPILCGPTDEDKENLSRLNEDELFALLSFRVAGPFNMEETIDGCDDLKVVTTGCLSACGIPDLYFQELVDQNNLDKFGPGGYRREDGKWMKPPSHQPPKIAEAIVQLKIEKGLYDDRNPYLRGSNVPVQQTETQAQDSPVNSSVDSTRNVKPGHAR